MNKAMNKTIKTTIFILLTVFSVCTAYASDDLKRKDIEQLLGLTNADSVVDAMYAQMDQMMANMGSQMGIKPAEQKYLDKFMKKISDLMKNEMSWEKMKKPIIDVYVNNYSEKEIKDIVAFYETDSGKSMIAKTPKVMQESMQISQSMMMSVMPKIQQMAQELQEEVQAGRKQ